MIFPGRERLPYGENFKRVDEFNFEEVVDGKSERGGHPVVRMPLRQWLLRITAYAERLLEDLALVDWPLSRCPLARVWFPG